MKIEIRRWLLGATRQVIRTISLLIVLSLLLSGCVGTPSMLKPASVSSARISDLTWSILAIAAFVFVVVEALLIFAAFRYRRRAGQGLPKQITGNTPLEIGWTSFPAIVLAIVFALTLGTLLSISNSPAVSTNNNQPTQVLNIRVIGHQWWWEYQYPDLKITTANEMHIPVGATVNLDIESADVIHSFWVPELGHKVDAIPGLTNNIWYRATKPGRYEGQCSEFCGSEHALMHIVVIADPPDQFLAWAADQQKPVPALTGAAAQGEQAFLASPCVGCHTIDGTAAQGKIGPNLTHFGSRTTFAGAAFENNADNVTSWIMDPQAMKPGNIMPNLGMTPTASQMITQFLETLK